MYIRKAVLSGLASAAVLLGATADLSAVKAYPGVVTISLADGTSVKCRLVGDEYYHAYVSEDGYLIEEKEEGMMSLSDVRYDSRRAEKERALRRSAREIPGQTAFPTTGNLKGIVLLVEFADNGFYEEHTLPVFQSVMNAEGCNLYGATGSARDYFVDQSSGLFTPDFDVVGPIKLSRKMSYYGANNSMGEDAHAAEMIKEACELAANEHDVDFSQYDYDGNGEVDFVYVIYAGYSESYGASSNTIWPHASNLSSHMVACEVSGKTIGRYACSGELKYVSGATLEGIGTFCHEFGHVLGLPDMYNTRYAGDVQLGSWDVMDQGSYNNESHTPPSYSAFERGCLGWLEFTELDTPSECVTLPELNESNKAYRISTADENEFFTLENRQQAGWDKYQPGTGLMIIHVAYDKSAWDGNFVNSGIIRRYDLVEADGTQGTHQEGDLFPSGGNDRFTDYSNPSSLAWDGTPTEKGVTRIKNENGVITFSFMKDRLSRPSVNKTPETGEDYFVASWEPVDGAYAYRMNIREEWPVEMNPVLVDEDFSGMDAGGYPNADMNDIGDSLDDYLSMSGWYGTTVYQAGGWLLVGYYGQSGELVSPPLEIGDGESCMVALRVKSYPGKSVNYQLSVTDAATGSEIGSLKGKATKVEQDIILPLESVAGGIRVKFSTFNERVYVDAIRVLRGDVGAEGVWTVGPKSWIIDDIVETECRVDSLVGGFTYHYSVEAMSDSEMHDSLPSEEISVTIGKSSVDGVACRVPVITMRCNPMGVPVDEDYGGIVIETSVSADGTMTSRRTVRR